MLAVFRFEWKRSLTLPRIVWWILLAAFPPVLFGLIGIYVGLPLSPEPAEIFVYILCPGVVCMLGTFLWAAPWLSAELEGRSWVYLTSRPHGAVSVLLGKYLLAVTWALPAGLISSTLSALIMVESDRFRLVWVMGVLVMLSCLAYAAVFVLLGTLFPKRAMVIGVFYALVFEVVLASIPAAVNLITVQFRLRSLLIRWLDWESRADDVQELFRLYVNDESAVRHACTLLAMTAVMLLASATIVQWKEFTTASETDV